MIKCFARGYLGWRSKAFMLMRCGSFVAHGDVLDGSLANNFVSSTQMQMQTQFSPIAAARYRLFLAVAKKWLSPETVRTCDDQIDSRLKMTSRRTIPVK
jgi:hypothetical protein